jgi:hypothetical protein
LELDAGDRITEAAAIRMVGTTPAGSSRGHLRPRDSTQTSPAG